MSDYPPTLVTACCDPEHGKAKEDIFEQPHVPDLIIGLPHTPAGTSHIAVALLSARDCVESKSYRAALDSAQAPQWQAAMQQEHSSLMDNGTWELVDLPIDRVVVNIMWNYKVRSDTVGDVSRFKARFVANGCSQRNGLDYTETYSPIIPMASLRLFLAIAAARDIELCQLDIDTAFLYTPIKEDVYIRQPLGFADGTSKVCHLKRCLYGLKQSPREFNMLLRAWLVDHGWQQCVSDPCIYIFRSGHVFAMIALYVDDIPAACNDATWLASFKAQRRARFKIKDMGDLSQLLGMHITRDRSARTISLDQSKYLRDILAKYGMTDSRPSLLPMDPGFLAGLAHMTPPPLLAWPRTSTQVY
jgi:hypothetical protein